MAEPVGLLLPDMAASGVLSLIFGISEYIPKLIFSFMLHQQLTPLSIQRSKKLTREVPD
jgi:hypothetical protein